MHAKRLAILAAGALLIVSATPSMVAATTPPGLDADRGHDQIGDAFSADPGIVHVRFTEGAFTEKAPDRPLTAVRHVDDAKLRLTLDRWPLEADKPAWLTVKVKNEGDTAITYTTDGCEDPVIVRAQMLDEEWRPYEPVDVEAIRAAGLNEGLDFRYRVQEWTDAGSRTIYLRLVPKWAIGQGDYGCVDLAVLHRVPPGGAVERRLRWDSQAWLSLGPPPAGLARISGEFVFRRKGSGRQAIEVELDVPVHNQRDAELLHPMEAVDAALADDGFRELIESVNLGNRAEEAVLFDTGRGVWVVGACADGSKWMGNWRAAVVDATSGEVERLIERVTGMPCHQGPWANAR